MADIKGLNRDAIADEVLRCQSAAYVARKRGVTERAIHHHLERRGVIRSEYTEGRPERWVQIEDSDVETALERYNYDIDEAATRLNVHPSFVQGCINRLYISGLKER